jgi:acyl-CoA synthetase (AMP-forming)/AMP-acid ligase II
VTLVDAARRQAALRPQADAFIFLERGEREAGRLSYAQLDLRARAIAAWLRSRGEPGARVALALPTGTGFVESFFGCLYAGMVPVPLPELDTRRGNERAQAICRDAGPGVVLTNSASDRARARARELTLSCGAQSHAPDDIADEAALAWQEPGAGPGTLAFLQYTSGSTRAPRGVMVSHAALLANLRMIATAFRLDERSRSVSWLPLHHDMGLLGGVLGPVFLGVCSVLLPPLSFLQSPLRWPRAVAQYRGTVSGGPSFAYELCARWLERRPEPGLDLSCWSIAFCGSEPVRADALERFARAAGRAGLPSGALLPCYGLAEATLLVSAGTPGAGIECFAPDAQGRSRVDCGQACEGERIEVADPESGAPAAEGQVGEILVSGPNLAHGYWNRPEESERLFRDRADGTRWLRTGDLGFLRAGRLAVTGRLKDLLIIRGQNHHPEDVEQTLRQAHPALAAGAGAAFSVDAGGGEALVLVHELERGLAPVDGIAQSVVTAVAEQHGLSVHELVLIRPMTLPRTANGKVQRARCRENYLAGELAVLERITPAAARATAP